MKRMGWISWFSPLIKLVIALTTRLSLLKKDNNDPDAALKNCIQMQDYISKHSKDWRSWCTVEFIRYFGPFCSFLKIDWDIFTDQTFEILSARNFKIRENKILVETLRHWLRVQCVILLRNWDNLQRERDILIRKGDILMKSETFWWKLRQFDEKMSQFDEKMRYFDEKMRHFDEKMRHFDEKMRCFTGKWKHFDKRLKNLTEKLRLSENPKQ